MTNLSEVSPGLIEALRHLGDEYGPMGVALTAAQLTDLDSLIRELARERERPRLIAHMEHLNHFVRETDERVYVPLDDVIDVVKGHAVSARPPDARATLDAARRAAAGISDQDRASIQEGFRRADEDTRRIREGDW